MSDDQSSSSTRPYASWVSFVSGLTAMGLSLYVLLSGDLVEALKTTPKPEPLLMYALVEGIIGTIAGAVALARKEPRRFAMIALFLSIVAIVAKFFLAALAVAVLVGIAMLVILALN